MIKMKRNILAISTTLVLAGCGGGGGESSTDSSSSSKYSVTAIDGYLQNAEVWLDLNENFELDVNEPNTLSGEGGVANLEVGDLVNPEQYPVVVRAIVGQTEDEDQGLVTTGYVMSAPAGETAVTPLSTLVHVILKRNQDDTDAPEEVAQKKQSAITQVSVQLGIESDDVLGDFIKSDAKDVIFAAENIVSAKVLPANPRDLLSITDSTQAEADKFIQQTSVITREIKNVVEEVNPDFNTPVYNAGDDFEIDSDSDGYPDKYDAFPGDATEFVDTDGDQIGNNADLDDDGDGLSDILEVEKNTNPLLSDTDGDGVNDLDDAFPIDANETLDTDSDGLGNNADLDDDGDGLSDADEAIKGSNPLLSDTDDDGVNDLTDSFPNDDTETLDSDSDGTGNNADLDDDGDGLSDADEAIKGSNPLLSDTDGDGVNDSHDALPNDDTETIDTDSDGIGNNADTDDDGDGLSDVEEATIGSDSLLSDTDGDGVNDNDDAFPVDGSEALDSDGDNIGDNADLFPHDSGLNTHGAAFDSPESEQLIGSWVYSEGTHKRNVLTFIDTSRYALIHEHASDDQAAGSVEYGTYAWNHETGALTFTVQSQSDGSGGFSNDDEISLTVYQKTLEFNVVNDNEKIHFSRVGDSTYEMIGAWYFEDTVFTVLSDSEYVVTHWQNTMTNYEDGTTQALSGEFGSYTNNDVFQVTNATVDTDGKGGLYDASDLNAQAVESLTLERWGELTFNFVDKDEYPDPVGLSRLGAFTAQVMPHESSNLGNLTAVRTSKFSDDELTSKDWILTPPTVLYKGGSYGPTIRLRFADNGSGSMDFGTDADGHAEINTISDWRVSTSGSVQWTETADDGSTAFASLAKVTGGASDVLFNHTGIDDNPSVGGILLRAKLEKETSCYLDSDALELADFNSQIGGCAVSLQNQITNKKLITRTKSNGETRSYRFTNTARSDEDFVLGNSGLVDYYRNGIAREYNWALDDNGILDITNSDDSHHDKFALIYSVNGESDYVTYDTINEEVWTSRYTDYDETDLVACNIADDDWNDLDGDNVGDIPETYSSYDDFLAAVANCQSESGYTTKFSDDFFDRFPVNIHSGFEGFYTLLENGEGVYTDESTESPEEYPLTWIVSNGVLEAIFPASTDYPAAIDYLAITDTDGIHFSYKKFERSTDWGVLSDTALGVIYSAVATIDQNTETHSGGTDNTDVLDSDGDGLSDADEVILGTDPALSDTDGDGINDLDDAFPIDANEILDSDGDGIGDNADLFPYDSTLSSRGAEFDSPEVEQLQGSWIYSEGDNKRSLLTFIDASRYVVIHEYADDGGQTAGSAEYGSYTWDLETGALTFAVLSESDGAGGFSDVGEISLTVYQTTLALNFVHENEIIYLSRVGDSTYEMVGAWLLEGNVLTLLSDNEYVIAHWDNTESYVGEVSQALSGEFGTYTNDTGFQFDTVTVDTDGEGGFYNREELDHVVESLTLQRWGELTFVFVDKVKDPVPVAFSRIGDFSTHIADIDSNLGDLGNLSAVRAEGFTENELKSTDWILHPPLGGYGYDNDPEITLSFGENGLGEMGFGSETNIISDWKINDSGTVQWTETAGDNSTAFASLSKVIGDDTNALFYHTGTGGTLLRAKLAAATSCYLDSDALELADFNNLIGDCAVSLKDQMSNKKLISRTKSNGETRSYRFTDATRSEDDFVLGDSGLVDYYRNGIAREYIWTLDDNGILDITNSDASHHDKFMLINTDNGQSDYVTYDTLNEEVWTSRYTDSDEIELLTCQDGDDSFSNNDEPLTFSTYADYVAAIEGCQPDSGYIAWFSDDFFDRLPVSIYSTSDPDENYILLENGLGFYITDATVSDASTQLEMTWSVSNGVLKTTIYESDTVAEDNIIAAIDYLSITETNGSYFAIKVLSRENQFGGFSDTDPGLMSSEIVSITKPLDSDDDGIANYVDTDDDGDGLSDVDEATKGTNPLLSDTDADGVNDFDDAFPTDNTETVDTDGDGIGDNADTSTAAPEAVSLALTFSSVKRFDFSWTATSDATHYSLLENEDGQSGFTTVVDNIEASLDTLSHIVPLYARMNAQYILQSCNDLGCTDSEAISVSGNLVDSIGYVKASNPGYLDSFGSSLTLSSDGKTLAVAAAKESSNAQGIGGHSTSYNVNDNYGAVYVFTLDTSNNWSQQVYLKASNSGATDYFGSSLVLSSDGDTLAVGAWGEGSDATGIGGTQTNNSNPFSGAVYVFTRNDSDVWSQQAYVKASNSQATDYFGSSLDLSSDGDTLAVGASGEDSNADSEADNSYTDSGAVYVFTRDSAKWSQIAYVKASNADEKDTFGSSLSLSADGGTLAVGARAEASNAIGINDDQTNNSSDFSGAVYVFTRDSDWSQQAYVKASNSDEGDLFGESLALSSDGDTLAVGAKTENGNAIGINGSQTDKSPYVVGAVYVFTRDSNTWSQQAYVKASNTEVGDSFGTSLALSSDGDTLVVGAQGEKSNVTGLGGDQADNSLTNSGAVYVFRRNFLSWSQQAYVKASNTGKDDSFGAAIDISGDGKTLAVGAPLEDGSGTGSFIVPSDSGAVYLY